jgi:hypothetical protein
VMNFKSGRRRGVVGLALIGGLLTAALGISSTASAEPDASAVLCGGKITFNKPGHPSSLLDANFHCNKDIKGFSIVSNTGVDFFHSEAIVFDKASGDPSSKGEGFDCEGPIPGWGFGCRGNGKITYEDTTTTTGALALDPVLAEFGIFRNPCGRKARKKPLRVWVTVSYDRLKPTDSSLFPANSEPFRLKRPTCPPLPKRLHRHLKRH